jgi:NAD-dependent deacetylase
VTIVVSPELIAFLRTARYIAILTGAGISAESGIPTFRDAQTGLWKKYRPEDLATPEAFLRNPKIVWEWYGWRSKLVADVQPNPAHYALAEMERLVPRLSLITQNVDGLHQRAGSQNVIELHGNLFRTKCFDENIIIESWEQTGEMPPRCPRCGSFLRPDVVWFGELLPYEALEAAREAAQKCDVFFSVGTSALVQPAASLPLIALERGAVVVEVNPQETPLTRWASYTFHGPAGEVLPELVKAVWKLGEYDQKSGFVHR